MFAVRAKEETTNLFFLVRIYLVDYVQLGDAVGIGSEAVKYMCTMNARTGALLTAGGALGPERQLLD